jgi:CRP/FNR family transcriptional regulator, cyclic AMP receptor protein
VSEGFLSELEPEEREDLERLGTVRRYRRGDVLFHQGDDAGAVVVLLDGHVKAAMLNDGREVILAFPGPGELLGELSAVDGEPRSGTVRAVDDVKALVIPGSAFRAFLEHRPRIALVLLRMVAARLRAADRQRVDYAVNDVVVRVAGRLVELCDRYGAEDGAAIDVGLAITQDEIAAWAGASREAVAKAMSLLRTLGWIQTERRRILVLDLPALRRYSTS